MNSSYRHIDYAAYQLYPVSGLFYLTVAFSAQLQRKTDKHPLLKGTKFRKLCSMVKYFSFLDELKRIEIKNAIDNEVTDNLEPEEVDFWEERIGLCLQPSSSAFHIKDQLKWKREFGF